MEASRVVAYLFAVTGVITAAWGLEQIYSPLAPIFVGGIMMYIGNFMFEVIHQQQRQTQLQQYLERQQETLEEEDVDNN